MSEQFFDHLETREPAAREQAQFNMLPDLLRRAVQLAPGWADQLQGIDPRTVTSRHALAGLPILRKSSLRELQARRPPLGGLATAEGAAVARIFMSPGPIFEPEGRADDWWRSARALHAAGLRRGDVALNTFSYHLTPGGWILDAGLRALGCAVIPAGPANIERQLEAISRLRPIAYVGVPDYLKILMDRAREAGFGTFPIRKALVSGGALSPALRQEYRDRGIAARQAYAIADAGLLAYETDALEGLIVDEGVIIEIVRPGTGDPVPDGEVGEVVVTTFNRDYPMIRLATGDLSAVLPGLSRCGRTNMRILGWLGRADQSTRIKGQFVHPEQVAEIGRRYPQLGRLRLIVGRAGEVDTMTLKAECPAAQPGLAERIAGTLADLTSLNGEVQLVTPGTLPSDGKVIVDDRDHC